MQASAIKSFYDIPGFFWWLDRKVFAAVLEAQSGSPPGALVEVGAYLGRSSVIVGDFVRPGDRFIVVDLFGDNSVLGASEADAANRRENEKLYKPLTRQGFEANYLALHPSLPEILQAPSSEITRHVPDGSARFVHVDGSHLYPHVRLDVLNAKRMLRPGGLAVFDDYRSEHTPGVSAAVWESVVTDGLVPVALTPMKFYGVYDDPAPYADAIRQLVASDRRFWSEEQEIMGRSVLRVGQSKEADTPTRSPAADDRLAEAIADRVWSRVSASLPVAQAGGDGDHGGAKRQLPDAPRRRARARASRFAAALHSRSSVVSWVKARRPGGRAR